MASKSRAQQIRERRNQPKSKSLKGKSQPSSRGLPPVMVRGGGYSPAPKKSKRRKPVKRRYDIAMATPGVEIRLPSVPDVKIGWRVVSLILTAGLTILLYLMWNSPTFKIQEAEVQGAVRLTSTEINRALNMMINTPIFTVNPQELENTLQFVYQDLKAVSVQVGLPASVIVNIEERIPQISWMSAEGLRWVDDEGFGFTPKGEVEGLIQVEAYANPPMPAQVVDEEPAQNGLVSPANMFVAPTAFLPPELVEAIQTLGPQTPEGVPLVYDSRHGLGWHDSRGWDVYFGMEVASLEEKLLVYDAIVQQLLAEGITPALINVEHVHAPFYRLTR